MLIDWFTVIAQIINFLILVTLLRHFLYGRIIKAMDQREEKIASRWKEAEDSRKEAQERLEVYKRKDQEWNEKRGQMLSQAREEAENQRKELIKKAREEVAQIQARWQEAIQCEKDSFLQNLRQQVSRQVYVVARHALTDLADTDLEQQIIDVFIRHIYDLDRAKLKEITEAIRAANNEVVINSTFEIPENTQKKIAKALKSRIDKDLNINYQRSPDMAAGIELKAHGHKIAWSLDNYLESLEENISELLEQEAKTESSQNKGTEDESQKNQSE